jgi:hypothetical protein
MVKLQTLKNFTQVEILSNRQASPTKINFGTLDCPKPRTLQHHKVQNLDRLLSAPAEAYSNLIC